VNTTVSPVNYCYDTDIPSQCQHTGGFETDNLAVDGYQWHGSHVRINSADSNCELLRDPCQNLSRSTASDGNSGSLVDYDVINGDYSTDRLATSGEVTYQLVDGQQAADEVTSQQDNTVSDVADNRHPPSDQNSVQCHDWQFFAAQRVDVPLLLDILLSRKHRDRTAREFLLGLPASVLKKYEVFSHQHPVFVCLDIVK